MSLAGLNTMNSIGSEVKINRGGPDSIVGVLVGIQNGYLAVATKEGIVYVNSTHIKSISSTGKSGGAKAMTVDPIMAGNFAGLLHALRYQRVQINRGGPEKVEGVVADVNQSTLTVVAKKDEVISIPIFHVKSVMVIGSNTSGGNKNKSGGNKNQSKGNQSGGNQSKGNQTRGNQTKGNQTRGNQTRGNKTRGNQTRGNQTRGNQTRGNQTRGNQTRGNQTRGNQTRGNKTRGNQTRGNHTKGNLTRGAMEWANRSWRKTKTIKRTVRKRKIGK
ncbi:hypothetical protein [Paenibacillus sp. VMFN-D1]|uniref:hypothetical protein n=1 Tax=Paenibacillus sp. VMFN-D1 TaxID=2135608 RepID=UPI0011C080C6|nr:hypothetical protein [Paenibacillus sp. VMFN-D1]